MCLSVRKHRLKDLKKYLFVIKKTQHEKKPKKITSKAVPVVFALNELF